MVKYFFGLVCFLFLSANVFAKGAFQKEPKTQAIKTENNTEPPNVKKKGVMKCAEFLAQKNLKK